MDIKVAKTYITIDGKPTFILCGDFSYGRIPFNHWRDRLLLMKNAGLNCVSFYCVWRFHEREENCWDFSGNNDIAKLLDLIAELGMYAIFRMGPFVHGEFKNGGYPDYLVNKLGDKVRSNHPDYLGKTKIWYEKLIEIAKPRQISNNGPIVIIQLENELGSAGCKGDDIPKGTGSEDENQKHIKFYRQLINEAELDVALIDINKIENVVEIYNGKYVETGGHYPASCFGCDGELSKFSPTQNREKPMLTIETGAGMFQRFFDYPSYRNTKSYQGPIINPTMVEALAMQGIAEGANGIGFFIFCDGQQFFNDHESMLPWRDMNFQAPLSKCGTIRESYKKIKRLGWFIRSFERNMLKSSPYPYWATATAVNKGQYGAEIVGDLFENYEAENIEESQRKNYVVPVESCARVTFGLNLSDSNFLFMRNVSQNQHNWLRNININCTPNRLACEIYQEYPLFAKLDMPPMSNKIMPFFVKLDKQVFLQYSTATLLDRREAGNVTQVTLWANNDEFSETAIVLPENAKITKSEDLLVIQNSPNLYTILAKVSNTPKVVEFTYQEKSLKIVLLNEFCSENVWDMGKNIVIANDLIVTENLSNHIDIITDKDYINGIILVTDRSLNLSSCEAKIELAKQNELGLVNFSATLPKLDKEIDFVIRQENSMMILEADIQKDILDGVEDLIVKINFNGDCGKAYFDDVLVSDHYLGKFMAWEISFVDWLKNDCKLTIELTNCSNFEYKVLGRRKIKLQYN